jgi:hypothetical protein
VTRLHNILRVGNGPQDGSPGVSFSRLITPTRIERMKNRWTDLAGRNAGPRSAAPFMPEDLKRLTNAIGRHVAR